MSNLIMFANDYFNKLRNFIFFGCNFEFTQPF